MAYNPFNIFRRNQKALFAVLTVFVMIVFTLSSGVAGGDFFETFSRWLGAKSGSKEAVCKIDGHTVTAGELDQGPRSLQFRRVMANRFMYYAARETVGELMAHISQQRNSLSEAGKQMADSSFLAMQIMGDPRFRGLGAGQFLQSAENAIRSILESPNAKSEDKDVARALQTVFNLSRYMQEGQSEHYFVNAPNKTRRDLIEFLLWKKKAEQLGIQFTRDDVKKLIQHEFYNYFRSDVNVRRALQQTQGFTMDACLDALAVEFQVRAAQTAVLGYGARYQQAPVLAAPYEMYEYYRDKTSPATYDVLSIPAAAFVDKVKGEPTETEINDLFKKYADVEPNPKSETPGFKEPRKLSIGWLAIKGDEPYYKKLAEEQVKAGEVMAKLSGVFTAPVPGALGTWVAGVVGPLSIPEPAVDAAYARRVAAFKEQMRRNYEKPDPSLRPRLDTYELEDPLLPSSVVRPGVIAATLGGFVGQTAGFGNPIAAVATSMAAPIGYEIRDRVKVGVPLRLGLFTAPALLPGIVGAEATSVANEPKPLPIAALRPELLKDTVDQRAKVLAFGTKTRPNPMMPDEPPAGGEKGDVARFIEELGKLAPDGRPKDRAAVDKYIKDFVASRGLTMTGASTAPRDEWTLEDDPGLAPLLDAHRTSVLQAKFMGAHGGGVEPYFPFGRSFFWTPDKRSGRPVPTSGLFQAEQYPPQDRQSAIAEGRPHFVVWRTEEVAPRKLDRSQARPAVVAAWKRMKAREMAQAHANAVAEAIRKDGANDPALVSRMITDLQLATSDPKARARTQLFRISNVAPLTLSPAPFPGAPTRLQPFGLPESEDIPYPTEEMVTALVENRDKPARTVLVLPDAPKDTFYVATLLSRKLRQPGDFATDVFPPGKYSEIILDFRRDAMRRAHDSAIELLKKEFKYEETDDQKKKLDENTKSGGKNAD